MAKEEAVPLLREYSGLDSETISTPKRTCKLIAKRVAVTLVCIIALLTVLTLGLFTGRNYNKSNVCTSPACIHASSEILNNLSPDYKTIDPCSNFEELVCGGWKERHDLRPDQGDAFTGTIMNDNSEKFLKHILEAPYPRDSKYSKFPTLKSLFDERSAEIETNKLVDEENFNKVKSAYNACMDEAVIEKQGTKPLMKTIQQISTLFPVSESAILGGALLNTSDEIELSETLVFLEKLGIASLISLKSGPDDKNPDIVIVKASPPKQIGLPAKDYYENDSILQKYNTTMAQVFNNLDLPQWQDSQSNMTQWLTSENKSSMITLPTYLAQEVIKFEKRLSSASPNASDNNDVTKYYNPISIEVADKFTPQIRLSEALEKLTPHGFETQNLIISSPEYMKSLKTLLEDSPKGVVQAYFIWKFIQVFASAIEAKELKPYSRFLNELQGKDPESTPERWRRCIGHVDGGLGWILSRFYVEKAFSENAKHVGDKIVSDIKATFIERLEKTLWMDSNVKKLAIAKVRQIVQKIGYPSKSPNILDPIDLKAFYSSANITDKDFFENSLSLQRFLVAQNWANLGKPVNRDEWSMTVPTVNAYYSTSGNEIVFPAGIMQFPVFDAELPQYLNYGAFGSVSGHELSHAFDSTGRHYDQEGKYTDWWSARTVANFEKRAQCFVNQYANFTVDGLDGEPLHVDGKLTLGENIADAGGVSAAFSAWKKHRANNSDQNLPGLEHFTQDQLFFVSFGNWWCSKSRKETAVSRIYSDPHSPMWVRVLGTMSNSRDFKESFNCTVKKPVCELW